MFFSPRRLGRFDVLLPMSLFSEVPSLREKTLKVGYLARVLATFRVSHVVFYADDPDSPDLRNVSFLREVLEYLCTAPYLRRRLYPIKPRLRYAGLLPPLNIPTHPEGVGDEEHYREGLVIAGGEVSVIEAGLGRPLRVGRRYAGGRRVILKVRRRGGRVVFKVVPYDRAGVYYGYRVVVTRRGLGEAVERYSLRIAASRVGDAVYDVEQSLREGLRGSGRTCVAFGSAERGIEDMLGVDGMRRVFSIVVNTIPNQGVRTVRTEEALAYTLAILNMLNPG